MRIESAKAKKEMQGKLDLLKNYEDDKTKRDFYLGQLSHSVLSAIDALRMVNQEIPILEYMQVLKEKEAAGEKIEERKLPPSGPLKVMHLTKDNIHQLPYLMS
jgi:hypothetical protein